MRTPTFAATSWALLSVALLGPSCGGGDGFTMTATITGMGANNRVTSFSAYPLGSYLAASPGGPPGGRLAVVGQLAGHPNIPQLWIHVIGPRALRPFTLAPGGLKLGESGVPGQASFDYDEYPLPESADEPRTWHGTGEGTLDVTRYDVGRFEAKFSNVELVAHTWEGTGTLLISGNVVSSVKE